MTEELDISNIITNNVKEYLVPKNKIYRLKVNIIGMNDDDEEPTFYINDENPIIEVIDNEKEYYKLIENFKENDGYIKSIITHLDYNKFLIAKTMFNDYKYMNKYYFDLLTKNKKLRLDGNYAIILHSYKQLA